MKRTLPTTWVPGWAAGSPHREALTHGGADGVTRTTWRQLQAAATHLAGQLSRRGVHPGDRVAVCLGNRTEMVVAFLASTSLGAIFVPLNHRLSANEVAVITDDSEPALVLYDASTRSVIDYPGATAPGVDVDVLLAAGPAPAPPPWTPRPDDPIALLYTSGTTGRPKGAVLTHDNVAATAENQREALNLTADDVHLVVSPLSFTGGILTSLQPALATGGRVVLMDSFDADRVLATLRTERPTVFMAVPAMLALLRDRPGFTAADLDSLRYLGSGSAPVSPELFARYQELGVQIGHAYGLTEGGGLATVLPAHEAAGRIGSAGRPCRSVELRIVGPDGRPLPTGEVGEIQQRGPSVMHGYWRNPSASADTLKRGWLATGDLGRLDADGMLTVVGRMKEVILSGGINVYPTEVEAALGGHEAVAEVAVLGVPHPTFGETVVAFVVRTPGGSLTAEELLEFSRRHLADYKAPKRIDFVEALPRTASGKVIKSRLR